MGTILARRGQVLAVAGDDTGRRDDACEGEATHFRV
jgi:hypothetical protein